MEPELLRLRAKRRHIHRQLDRYQPLVARLVASLAETEAAIHVVEPQLFLHPRRFKPNPYGFVRGEVPRLALAMLRNAGRPLAVADIAVRLLAAKGITHPDWRATKRTREQVQQSFARLRRRGVIRNIGDGPRALRQLVAVSQQRDSTY